MYFWRVIASSSELSRGESRNEGVGTLDRLTQANHPADRTASMFQSDRFIVKNGARYQT